MAQTHAQFCFQNKRNSFSKTHVKYDRPYNLVPSSCLWPNGHGTNSRSHPDMRPAHTRAYARYPDIPHLVSHAHAWVGSLFPFSQHEQTEKITDGRHSHTEPILQRHPTAHPVARSVSCIARGGEKWEGRRLWARATEYDGLQSRALIGLH